MELSLKGQSAVDKRQEDGGPWQQVGGRGKSQKVISRAGWEGRRRSSPGQGTGLF